MSLFLGDFDFLMTEKKFLIATENKELSDKAQRALIQCGVRADNIEPITSLDNFSEYRKELNLFVLSESVGTAGWATIVDHFQSENAFPIVLITDRDDMDLAVRAMKRGVADCLSKDRATVERLIEVFSEILSGENSAFAMRRVDQKALQNIERITEVVNASNDGMCVIGKDYEVSFINPALEKRFGSLAGKKCFEYFEELNEPCTWCEIDRVLKGEAVRREWHSKRTGIYYDVIDAPAEFSEGEVSILRFCRDITQFKEYEKKLIKNEEYLRKIIENSNDSIFVHDLEGNIKDINQKSCGILGYSREELLKKTIQDLHPDRELDRVKEEVPKLIREGSICIETKFICSDKSVIDVEISSSIVDRGSQTVLGIARDISQRKKAEKILKESEAFSRTILDCVNEGIIVYDRELNYRVWNSAMEDLTGLKAENVLGKNAFEMFPHLTEQGIDVLLDKALQGESSTSHDTPFRVTDTQKQGWVVGSYSPHYDSEGKIIGVVGIIHDITERKEIERLLIESQERLNLAFSVNNIGFWDWDIPSEKIFFNPRCEAIFEYKLGEMTPHLDGLLETTHRDDRQRVLEEIDRHLAGMSENFYEEYRAIKKSGEMIWVSAAGKVVKKTADGKPLRIIGIVTDITVRKLSEEKIRKSEESFRVIFENALDPIFWADPDSGKILNCNRSAENLLERSKDEIIGLHQAELHSSEHGEIYRDNSTHQNKNEDIVPLAEVRTKSGKKKSVRISSSTCVIGGKRITQRIFHDLTESLRMKAELQASERKFRELFDNMENSVIILEALDEDGEEFVFTDFNRAAERSERLRKEAVIGRTVSEVYPNIRALGYYDVLLRVWRTGKPEYIPVTYYHDERIQAFRDSYLYRLPSGEIVAFINDVTDKVKATQELKILSQRLAEAEDNERKRISQELHDEAGSALATLGINLNILASHLPEQNSGEARKWLEKALDQVRDITSYIRDVSMQLNPPVLDEFGLFSALRWYSERFTEHTSIPVSIEGSKMEPRLSIFIERNLFRIVQETLDNVAKHSEASQVTISLSEDSSEKIILAISDDGKGFDAALIAHSQKVSDSAMGLLTIRERAESCGGKVFVNSKVGKGTTITIELDRQNISHSSVPHPDGGNILSDAIVSELLKTEAL